jgi:hypothetical protein
MRNPSSRSKCRLDPGPSGRRTPAELLMGDPLTTCAGDAAACSRLDSSQPGVLEGAFERDRPKCYNASVPCEGIKLI